MNLPVYNDLTATDDMSVFDFVSVGPRGQIHKRIYFNPTPRKEIVSLALGDLMPGQKFIDDQSISNNGDRNKILATVALAIDIYTSRYPTRWIYFEGSTSARTRLYRMVLSRNLEVLSARFHIYGEVNDKLQPFTSNMKVYGFLIQKKALTLSI
jgi:hypothetical protein